MNFFTDYNLPRRICIMKLFVNFCISIAFLIDIGGVAIYAWCVIGCYYASTVHANALCFHYICVLFSFGANIILHGTWIYL